MYIEYQNIYGGSAPKPPRFNALWTHEWNEVEGRVGFGVPDLPFTSHSPRRSGRSSALPYPPSEQINYIKKQ